MFRPPSGCRTVISLGLALCLGRRVHAENIRIEMKADVTVGDHITADVTASNSGDEAAANVVADALFAGHGAVSETWPSLAPGTQHSFRLTLPPLPGRGTYPLPIRLRYADSNGYEFSALLVTTVRSADALASPVHAQFELQPVGHYGAGTLSIENPSAHKLTGRVVLLLPAEFVPEPPSQGVEVPAAGAAEVPLALTNRTALLGSWYPAYTLFEYELAGVHHTVVSSAEIQVSFSDERRGAGWMIVGGVLLLLTALMGLAWRIGRR